MPTIDEFIQSASDRNTMPGDLCAELQALWHTKAGNWDQAHDIAQEIHTPVGSWIHALLHLIEGDVGNAGYWFHKAGQPIRSVDEIDELWREIAGTLTND